MAPRRVTLTAGQRGRTYTTPGAARLDAPKDELPGPPTLKPSPRGWQATCPCGWQSPPAGRTAAESKWHAHQRSAHSRGRRMITVRRGRTGWVVECATCGERRVGIKSEDRADAVAESTDADRRCDDGTPPHEHRRPRELDSLAGAPIEPAGCCCLRTVTTASA
jgi:hypothetical protein